MMAVHCNLSTLMGKRRYSIQDVHKLTGLSRSTVSSLYNDKATRIDFDTLEDETVTIRDRDTMEQVRVKIDDLVNWIGEKIKC